MHNDSDVLDRVCILSGWTLEYGRLWFLETSDFMQDSVFVKHLLIENLTVRLRGRLFQEIFSKDCGSLAFYFPTSHDERTSSPWKRINHAMVGGWMRVQRQQSVPTWGAIP